MFDIQQELKNLPTSPGVYIMKDADNKIIYVGKAIILRNRVKQYFQKSSNHTPKVLAMIAKIASFEYIVTDSEMEALILECNLIKYHRPHYNILLKDDKAYPYIKITMNEMYPRIMLARRIEKNDGAKYFGPYTSNYAVQNTINTIKKIFPVKTCAKDLPKDQGKTRPCLNFHLGRCLAPCQGNVDVEEYNDIIKDIISLLSGRSNEIIKKLEDEMKAEAKQLNFEKAAMLRDRIESISLITEKQKVDLSSNEDLDVIAIAKNDIDACVQIFFIREGKILGRNYFILEGSGREADSEIVSSFLKQFYASATSYPPSILVPAMAEDSDVIESWLTELRGANVNIKVPQRGDKHDLIKMVGENAKLSLVNFAIRYKGISEKNLKVLERLCSLTGIEEVPKRIEAYDVSNTGMLDNVASMVVFENGKPNKSEYKRFKIKAEGWPGDVPSMKEVLSRRFKHFDFETPDLILVDGGIGHVNAVLEEISKAERDDLSKVNVLGMVKDDKHRTRGLVNSDNVEYPLKYDLDVLRFVTSVQDEAHRFALEYNKKLRDKRYKASELDDIKGIGPKKKKELLKYFGSVAKIKKANKEELLSVNGITEKLADNIMGYFSK